MTLPKHISYKAFIQALYQAQTPKYMPGLYACYNASQEKVHYLYYCPTSNNKTFTNTQYTVFTHCRSKTTAIRFNMTGSIGASSYTPVDTIHYDKHATISNNFATLNKVIDDLQLESSACEIYIQPSITTNKHELSNYLHSSLGIWGIKNILSKHQPSAFKLRTNHETRWKNYTWIAIVRPSWVSLTTKAHAYSVQTLLSETACEQDPLRSAIPVVDNTHELDSYTNLFYASKQVGNNIYRGLDILCSDYVRWILTDDSFPNEKLRIHVKKEEEYEELIPLAAKKERLKKHRHNKIPLLSQQSFFYHKMSNTQEKQQYSI